MLRVDLYVALNSTRINCTVDFSKGACHEGSMGMSVSCSQPKWKLRTNCALLNGVLYCHKKVNTSHSNYIKYFVVVLSSINLLLATNGATVADPDIRHMRQCESQIAKPRKAY